MNENELRQWFEPNAGKITSLLYADGVAHMRDLSDSIYGYAILPGEIYEIGYVTSCYALKSEMPDFTDDDSWYMKYSPDEYKTYTGNEYKKISEFLVGLKDNFDELHKREDDDYEMDDIEIGFADLVIERLDIGLGKIKSELFDNDVFCTLWIGDTFNKHILLNSIRRHNDKTIFERMERLL